MSDQGAGPVRGHVADGFDRVGAAFAEVLSVQDGAGASLAVWHQGAWVVDVHGGFADRARTRPWAEDTLVMPYSVTKPFAAVAALTQVEAGLLDLDEPLQRHWPELTARTTLREALAHRSGLVAWEEQLPAQAWGDWDRLCAALAAQEPAWEPGRAQGEAALTYGHVLGEVVRRASGRTLGRVLAEEVCGPLGLDFHIGLGDAELARTADLTGYPPSITGSEGRPPLYDAALRSPDGARDPAVTNSEMFRRAEVPAVNGHGTARAVAGLYVALARGELLGEDTRRALRTGVGVEPDLVLGDEREWGLGVIVEDDGFGMGGVGGSFGWWSEVGGYAIAFLTGHIGDYERGDRLEAAVREVLGLPPV